MKPSNAKTLTPRSRCSPRTSSSAAPSCSSPTAVATLLHAASRVFEDFRYESEIGAPDGREHALVFSARVGDRKLDGCDFVHTDEHGLIDDFRVMVRPLSGALALAEAMKTELE